MDIEKAVLDLKICYGETLAAVRSLKDRMNRFELEICGGNVAATKRAIVERDVAAENLDKLTDSLILKNKMACEQKRKFEEECQRIGVKLQAMIELKEWCGKTERLASDLLCYALGRFKTNSP